MPLCVRVNRENSEHLENTAVGDVLVTSHSAAHAESGASLLVICVCVISKPVAETWRQVLYGLAVIGQYLHNDSNFLVLIS